MLVSFTHSSLNFLSSYVPRSDVENVNYFSRLSLEEAAGFSRDAFGRQSMSEKRHATLDAKNTDTYQRNKKLREERDQQRRDEIKHGSEYFQFTKVATGVPAPTVFLKFNLSSPFSTVRLGMALL